MKWRNGDAGVTLPPGEHTWLPLFSGQTTWMDRANWFVHKVHCPNGRPGNGDGFALSLHVYKSCTDEFEFMDGSWAVKRNPINDLFWNLDLPRSDVRVHEAKDFGQLILHTPLQLPLMWNPSPTAERFLTQFRVSEEWVDVEGQHRMVWNVSGYVWTKTLAVQHGELKVSVRLFAPIDNSVYFTVYEYDKNEKLHRKQPFPDSGGQGGRWNRVVWEVAVPPDTQFVLLGLSVVRSGSFYFCDLQMDSNDNMPWFLTKREAARY
mmetsp:Transcript_60636/g.100745  ORF Transcript_60636/g.100745 Transcript_60636/m.100745 type:complete len:263 (+) Transcript_60636:1-789(+)